MDVTTAFIKIKDSNALKLLKQILLDNNITEFISNDKELSTQKVDIIIVDYNYIAELCKIIEKLNDSHFLPVLAVTDTFEVVDSQPDCITDFIQVPVNKQEWNYRIKTFLSIRNRELTEMNQESFELLFDSLFMDFLCPTHMVNTNLDIVRTNYKLLELVGKKQEDIVGKKCYEIYQNRKQICDNCTVKKVLDLKIAVNEEEVHSFQGNNRYFEKSAYPIYNQSREIVYVVETAKEVTDKVLKQQSIKQDEENYRRFIEKSSDLIILFNRKGIIRFANKQIEKYGYAIDEVIGTSILNYIVKEKIKETAKHLSDLFDGKIDTFSFDNKIVAKDGSITSILSNDVLIQYKGELLDLAILKDITPLKRTEEQLRKNSETLNNIFNNSVLAIYVQEKDGTFLDVNSAAVAMYGYKSKDQLVGKNPSIISDDTKNNLEEVKKYMDLAFKGESQSFIFWGKKTDGTSFPKYVTIEKGSYFGKDVVFAYAIDVTDWFATQKQLEEREENYRAIVENIHDGLYIYNGKKLVFVNDQLCHIMGYSKEEMFTKDVWDFFHPEDRERIRKNAFARLSGEDVPAVFSSKIITKSGKTKYGEFMVRRINYHGEKAIMGAVRDVSEKIISDKQLLEAKNKAEESSRLKSAFLNNMNHELRTPMNAIMGFSELMDKAEPTQKSQFAGIIRNSAKQLLSLMDDVLYLSRLQSERLPVKNNYFSPCQVVDDVVKMFNLSNKNNHINIIVGNPDKLKNIEIYADESKVRQIITNFASNAVKHTFEGTVEIGFCSMIKRQNFM
jgi:PAS domain S-box-containing protein